jgi:hypothetical protein
MSLHRQDRNCPSAQLRASQSYNPLPHSLTRYFRLAFRFNRQPNKLEFAATHSKHRVAPDFNRQLFPCFTFASRNGSDKPTLARVPAPPKTALVPRLTLHESPLTNHQSQQSYSTHPGSRIRAIAINRNGLEISTRHTCTPVQGRRQVIRCLPASRASKKMRGELVCDENAQVAEIVAGGAGVDVVDKAIEDIVGLV